MLTNENQCIKNGKANTTSFARTDRFNVVTWDGRTRAFEISRNIPKPVGAPKK